jgi:hypothetical protein
MGYKRQEPLGLLLEWGGQTPNKPTLIFFGVQLCTAQIIGFVSDRINITCETVVQQCIETHCRGLLGASFPNCLLIATQDLDTIL